MDANGNGRLPTHRDIETGEAAALLAQLLRQRVPIDVHIAAAGWTARLIVTAPLREEDVGDIVRRTYLSELEAAAVLALEERPLSARAISMRLGLGEEVPTKLKNHLTGLSERDILGVTREGYAIVDPSILGIARACAAETD